RNFPSAAIIVAPGGVSTGSPGAATARIFPPSRTTVRSASIIPAATSSTEQPRITTGRGLACERASGSGVTATIPIKHNNEIFFIISYRLSSERVDGCGDPVRRARGGVHAPGEVVSERAGVMDPAHRLQDLGPELLELAQGIRHPLAAEGPGVLRPVVHDRLLDVLLLPRVEAPEGGERLARRDVRPAAAHEYAPASRHLVCGLVDQVHGRVGGLQ